MKEEKIFYLYFLNKMYRALEDQEIIDSFIEYETGIKNILMKMSNSSESSSFQESIAITLDVLKSANKQPRQLLVKVGGFA